MSSQFTSRWGTWQQTRNTLVQTLSMNMEGRNNVPPGSHDAVAYTRNIEKILDDIQAHAITGLKLIDDDIKASETSVQLAKSSIQLKREADRIRNATKKVEDLTALVTKLSKLVLGFASLG
jgi:hypothetical protein